MGGSRAMCFSPQMSYSFAAFGFVTAMFLHSKFRNIRFTAGILYFVLMEALQGLQYDYINDCANPMSSMLTIVGFAHICGQPFFTHLMAGAFYDPRGTKGKQNAFTLKLCVLGGLAFFSRWILAVHVKPSSYIPLDGRACPNTEWIRASSLTPGGSEASCTFKGLYHLAWSVPMYQPTYFTPSVFIHSFMMYAPFFVTDGLPSKVFGLFLLLTGPIMAHIITDNLNEQASIWCFFQYRTDLVDGFGSDKDWRLQESCYQR